MVHVCMGRSFQALDCAGRWGVCTILARKTVDGPVLFSNMTCRRFCFQLRPCLRYIGRTLTLVYRSLAARVRSVDRECSGILRLMFPYEDKAQPRQA